MSIRLYVSAACLAASAAMMVHAAGSFAGAGRALGTGSPSASGLSTVLANLNPLYLLDPGNIRAELGKPSTLPDFRPFKAHETRFPIGAQLSSIKPWSLTIDTGRMPRSSAPSTYTPRRHIHRHAR